MARMMIVNASPRAPKSNSKRYAEMLRLGYSGETEYFNLTKRNRAELCEKMEGFSDLVLVFPLYADGIPSTLLDFLKELEARPPAHKPEVSVLVNCGFIEPEQNDVAVDMVRLFCEANGYRFGSALQIGSGEAILDTPFKTLVRWRIGQFTQSIENGERRRLKVSMPLPKRLFLAASTRYWEGLGRKNGISREEMASMEIEGRK